VLRIIDLFAQPEIAGKICGLDNDIKDNWKISLWILVTAATTFSYDS
jgi:hypothetical protein